MFQKLLLVLVGLNVIGFAVFGFVWRGRVASKLEQHEREVKKTASRIEAMGLESAETNMHIRRIADSTRIAHAIPDVELSYLIGLLQDPKPKGVPAYVHMHAASIFTDLSKYQKGQKRRIIDACIPLVRSTDIREQREGLIVLQWMKDDQGVSDALPLTRSAESSVSKHAHSYLESVGYKAATR